MTPASPTFESLKTLAKMNVWRSYAPPLPAKLASQTLLARLLPKVSLSGKTFACEKRHYNISKDFVFVVTLTARR